MFIGPNIHTKCRTRHDESDAEAVSPSDDTDDEVDGLTICLKI